jgi:hypothetical protein
MQHKTQEIAASGYDVLFLKELFLTCDSLPCWPMWNWIHSFIHSTGMCRMWRFLAVLSSFFHSSLLHTPSFHPFPPTSLPSSLTSSCHLFDCAKKTLKAFQCTSYIHLSMYWHVSFKSLLNFQHFKENRKFSMFTYMFVLYTTRRNGTCKYVSLQHYKVKL